MAVTTINIGNIANDGTGDDLREAFVKVNNNFSELDQRIVLQADGTNLGTGEGIFYLKDGNNLQFKSLVAGNNVTLSSTANNITIDAPDPIKQLTFNAGSDSRVITASATVDFIGGQNIDTSITANNIRFDLNGTNLVARDTSPALGGNLDASNRDILNSGTISAESFTGPLTGLVYGIDIRDHSNALRPTIFGTDYGSIGINLVTGFELMFATSVISYGSITTPAGIESDYGTFVSPA